MRRDLPEQRIGEDRGGRPAFHVDGAAPEHRAVDDVARQRVARPQLALARRKDVDMAVEHEVRAGRVKGRGGEDVRHRRLRRHDLVVDALGVEEGGDKSRARLRVARRVVGIDAREVLKEADGLVLHLVDAAEQGVERFGHGRSCGMELTDGHRGVWRVVDVLISQPGRVSHPRGAARDRREMMP